MHHSARGFCFSGLPARRSPISLGAPSINGPGCVSPSPSESIFNLLIRSGTPLLNALRVGRAPSGTCVSRCHLTYARIEAFPAVYRAPGLLGTDLVMNSQGFADGPDASLQPTHSQPRIRVSLTRRLTSHLFRCLPTRFSEGLFNHGSEEQRFSGLPQPFCGARGFSPLEECHHSHPYFSIWFYQKAVRIPPGTSPHGAAP